MTSQNVPAVRDGMAGAVVQHGKYSVEEIETIKANHFKGLEEHQISYALKKAERMGLDFFTGDVVCWPGKEGRVEVYTTIGGLRAKAEETTIYFPGRAPTFEHDERGNIISCTAYVKRWDERENKYQEVEGIAFWTESSKNSGAWTTHKHAMIAKCAEAAALRRAFSSLHGLHIAEERDTAEDQNARKAEDRDAGRAATIRKLQQPTPAPLAAPEAKQAVKEPAIETTAEKVEPPPAASAEEQEHIDASGAAEGLDDAEKMLADTRAIIEKLSMPKRIVLFKTLGMATGADLSALSPEDLNRVFDAAVKIRG